MNITECRAVKGCNNQNLVIGSAPMLHISFTICFIL